MVVYGAIRQKQRGLGMTFVIISDSVPLMTLTNTPEKEEVICGCRLMRGLEENF